MVGKKSIRTKGKISLSRYFQKLKNGERVAVIREKAIQSSFPKILQGRTGVVEEKRGKAYLVRIKDQNQEKRYLIEAIHLKKIE